MLVVPLCQTSSPEEILKLKLKLKKEKNKEKKKEKEKENLVYAALLD